MADSSDIDIVRLLIADKGAGDDQLFSPADLEAFLTLEAGAVKLAAAQALDTIASSEVLVSKVIRTQDLSTDGAKVADALRKHAVALREQHKADVDETSEGFFEIVPFDQGPIRPELTEWPVY